LLTGFFFILTAVLAAVPLFAQPRPQEVSEDDGVPVLVKHLPEWERVRGEAVFATDKAGLEAALGARPIFALLEFSPGTEAATAPYPAGKLLIVEYTSPQAASAADVELQRFISEGSGEAIAYRRIGNYAVLVLDVTDAEAASRLMDQVKYEKTVQWLGEDPNLARRLERYLAATTRDILLSTVLVITFGLGLSVIAGIVAGFIFFRVRDQKRLQWQRFSDGGGLTRLNLDELTESEARSLK
jgi:hypothetical protein